MFNTVLSQTMNGAKEQLLVFDAEQFLSQTQSMKVQFRNLILSCPLNMMFLLIEVFLTVLLVMSSISI